MRLTPPPGPPRRLPPIAVERSVLTNGMRVAVVERRELPLVDLQLVMPPGAHIDEAAVAGRVSMMAEMLDEGTATRGPLEIADAFDFLGAHFDVHPAWDAATAALHVLSPRLDDALTELADVVQNATFPQDEFRRKQDERLGALVQERDEAAYLAGKALARGVFGPEHPYGAPLFGTMASISALAADSLRALYERTFRTVDAFVLVIGDVNADRAVAALNARFHTAAVGPPEVAATANVPRPHARRVLLVHKAGAAQAELRVGHAAPPRSTADYFALLLLNTVLGGSFTSRLNTILRERMGVTYGATSRFRLRRNGGLFSAGAAVFTQSVARSAEVVIEEMERIAAEAVPATELTRAQSYLALGLPRQFETTEDIAGHLREQILHELPDDYWETYVDRVFAVTPAEVQAAAARHLQPGASTIVVVADEREARRALEQANLGDVVTIDVET